MVNFFTIYFILIPFTKAYLNLFLFDYLICFKKNLLLKDEDTVNLSAICLLPPKDDTQVKKKQNDTDLFFFKTINHHCIEKQPLRATITVLTRAN